MTATQAEIVRSLLPLINTRGMPTSYQTLIGIFPKFLSFYSENYIIDYAMRIGFSNFLLRYRWFYKLIGIIAAQGR